MPLMSVTLEVSKLSGWLNADASCQKSKGGGVRCGARCGAGSREGLRQRAAGGARLKAWGPGRARSAR
eukprot:scaffold63096_cov53-Phaeocystis_antarctica.AAC.3